MVSTFTKNSASSYVARCIRPNCLPAENDFQSILKLYFANARALTVDDFINRSKLGTRLAVGCRQKAEKETGEGKNMDLTLDEVTASNREDLGRLPRRYVANLFNTTQGLTRFTYEIVRGLGSFDLEILLYRLRFKTYCFKQLQTPWCFPS